MAKLAIIYQPPAALKPRKSNPRTHSKAQLKQIADSIRTFGFINPVLVDEENRLIAGHGRLEAAQQIGMETIPTVCLAGMTEAQIRAYVIADNRLAENAGWDSELLAIELQYLADLDLDFDVTITGFSMPEIDVLIGGLDASAQKPDPADTVPASCKPTPTPASTGSTSRVASRASSSRRRAGRTAGGSSSSWPSCSRRRSPSRPCAASMPCSPSSARSTANRRMSGLRLAASDRSRSSTTSSDG